MLFTLIAVIGLLAADFSVMSSGNNLTEKRPRLLLIPHEVLEQVALRVFEAEAQQARSSGRLIQSGSEFNRIHAIVERIKGAAIQLYAPAQHWKWRTALVDQETINASCGTQGWQAESAGSDQRAAHSGCARIADGGGSGAAGIRAD